jgi:hypothetical protein
VTFRYRRFAIRTSAANRALLTKRRTSPYSFGFVGGIDPIWSLLESTAGHYDSLIQ